MLNVSFTSKMDKFLGSLGAATKGEFFEPVIDSRITELPGAKDVNDVLYRGMIMKYGKEKIQTYTAYSFIDLLSASGGTVKGFSHVFSPLAAVFSKISFELAVIGLLFKARFTSELSILKH